jgi:hypothetical protein
VDQAVAEAAIAEGDSNLRTRFRTDRTRREAAARGLLIDVGFGQPVIAN